MNIIINNYLQIRTYLLVGDYDITVNIEKEHYWAMYNLGFKFKISQIDRYIQMDFWAHQLNSLPSPQII